MNDPPQFITAFGLGLIAGADSIDAFVRRSQPTPVTDSSVTHKQGDPT